MMEMRLIPQQRQEIHPIAPQLHLLKGQEQNKTDVWNRKIRQALADGRSTLVAITGPSGVGKGTLSSQLAKEVIEDPEDTCAIKGNPIPIPHHVTIGHISFAEMLNQLGRRTLGAMSPPSYQQEASQQMFAAIKAYFENPNLVPPILAIVETPALAFPEKDQGGSTIIALQQYLQTREDIELFVAAIHGKKVINNTRRQRQELAQKNYSIKEIYPYTEVVFDEVPAPDKLENSQGSVDAIDQTIHTITAAIRRNHPELQRLRESDFLAYYEELCKDIFHITADNLLIAVNSFMRAEKQDPAVLFYWKLIYEQYAILRQLAELTLDKS